MRRLLLVLSLLGFVADDATAGAATHPQPEVEAVVHDLNLARWNPAQYGEDHGLDLSHALPRPPLAFSPQLTDSAQFKVDEMAAHGYFAHQSEVTGLWPNELARDHGYSLPGLYPDNANNIESLFVGAADPLALLLASALHQPQLLGTSDFWANHGEVGVGRSGSGDYWAIHTAYASESDTFITGVAYRDTNNNGRMDRGEALSGITITAGNRSTTTNGGGGYTIKAPSGKHTVTASGQGYDGTTTATIRIDDYNVGVDFVSGKPRAIVRNYQLCMGREPTIMGTNGNDTITGTPGKDIIHGLAGNDTIYGLKGNDIVCGGGGKDTIIGGAGDDVLAGNWGNDVLRGKDGDDTLKGGRGKDRCGRGETLISCER